MLDAIRRRAGSLVVKILFVFLTLSFVVWGVADVFRPGSRADWVARVGGEKIPTSVFQEEYRTTLQRLGASLGRPVDAEQARAFGLPNTVLQRLVDGALLDKAGAELGLRISDDAVRQAITSNPQFRNQLGSFDPQVFRATLAQAGYTEDRYVALLRRELLREQIITSLSEGIAVPKAMIESTALWRGERRTAAVVRIASAGIAVTDPDEPTLRQFHQDFPGLFTAPEYRTVTVITLSADDVGKGITIDEAALHEAYQDRQAEFTRPDRRTFRQLVFSDEAAARRAREALARGEPFAAVAAANGQAAAAQSAIGPVSREQLPTDLAAVVFQLSPGTISDPVHSALGWHVVEVTAAEPGSVQSFDEVKDKLAADLRHEKALDQMVDLGNKLEDTLGRGATLSEAAGELGLPLRTISMIDAQGRDSAGAPIDGLPARLVETAFDTPSGTDSALVEADQGTSFILHVDQVTPSAIRPFEAVRGQVAEAWRRHRRGELARPRAAELAERVRGGGALPALATAQGLKAQTTQPFTRTGEGSGEDLPPAVVEAVFAGKPGEVQVVPLDDGVAVVRIEAVLPATPDATADSAVRTELGEALGGDLLAQYAAGLRQRFGVEINPRALEQL